MDYQYIYNQIVERAKYRKLIGYKEKHHIVPKCIGGNNDKENIVELTAKEHFICHRLLCKIHPNHNGLSSALWLLINAASVYQNRYIPSAKIYQQIKIEYAKNQSKNKLGVKREKWVCDVLSKGMEGKKKSKEHSLNISKAKSGKGNHMFGKKGKNNPKSKQVYQKDLDGNIIKIWFGVSEIERQLNFKQNQLWWILNSKTPIYDNFIWEYKDKPDKMKHGKIILQLDQNNNIIKEWETATKAKQTTGFKGISECLVGRGKSAGGYVWIYKTLHNASY